MPHITNITTLDLVIIWFGLSSMVWLKDLTSIFSRKFNQVALVGEVLIVFFVSATAYYFGSRLTDSDPSGVATFLLGIDNGIGLMTLASISGILAFGLSYPFLKLGLQFLPSKVRKRVTSPKWSPPGKGSEAVYTFGASIIFGVVFLLIYNYFVKITFNSCGDCGRFSVMIDMFSKYLDENLQINQIVTRTLAFVAVLASILGAAKTTQELIRNIKPKKNVQRLVKTGTTTSTSSGKDRKLLSKDKRK